MTYNVVGHCDSLKIKKKRYILRICLVDDRRMLLLMAEQVISIDEKVWSCLVHIHNAQ